MKKILFVLVAVLVTSCVSVNKVMEDSPEVKVVVTYSNQSQLLKEKGPVFFYEDDVVDNLTINIDPTKEFQVMEGFGGALTQSSASIIYNHPEKETILMELFSEEGLDFNFIRLPLGASDFSLEWFSYADVPGDVDLEHFTLEQDEKYTIPVLKEIMKIKPNIQIVASPWSAPGWMKKGSVRGEKNLAGGFLDPDHYATYADYLVKVIEGYRAHGIEFHSITLQNEPLHYSANYPCMYMDSDHQRAFLKVLAPKLDAAGLDTKILLYDHNWDRPSYPRDVLDFLETEYFKYIKGAAFHGYGGSPFGQSVFKKDYPDMNIYFTEITGGGWATAFPQNLRWINQNVLIGSVRNFSSAIMYWNFILDENGGPNIRGKSDEPGNIMRGILTANSKSGKIVKEVEYYAFAQFSKYVKPGAVRILSTNSDPEVISAAFRNPNGEIVLVVLNGSWHGPASFKVNIEGKSFDYTLPVESVATFIWEE